MRSQALPLLLRLLLPLALLVLGAGSVRTALLWRDEVVLGSLRTQQFVDDFQRLYAPRLAELHASGNDSALRDLLRASVTRYPELARVTWRGQDGLAVVVSGVPVVLGVPSWVQWLQTVPGMPNALRDSQRRQTLLHQGREHGTLEISISSATEMNRIWKSVRTQIWTVAGVLAVLLALIPLVLRSSLRGLRDLSRAARLLPEQPELRMPPTGAREVRQLTEAFNAMAHNLQVARSQTQEQLTQTAWVASHDVLTGLPNRMLMADRLQQALLRCERYRETLALCFIDLDHFKPVNDHFGHEAGDEVLKTVARRMLAELRDTDTLARLGGDEFVLLLTNLTHADEALAVVQRVLTALRMPIVLAQGQAQISGSAGLTLQGPLDAAAAACVDADQLLRQADLAMYQAKQLGRNRVVQWLAEPSPSQSMAQALVQAMQRGELRLHYQPKVHLGRGEVVGFEALLRWQHPQRGLLLPGDFLPAVEQTQTIVDIGQWVLNEALRQLQHWALDAKVWPVSINVAARQLMQPDFIPTLSQALLRTPLVKPQWLTLELLETSAMDDMAQVSATVHDAQSLGVHCSLDDFGTGYSSLTYLKELPVHEIKIDRSFVRDILDDTSDMALVEGIISLAQVFDRHLVAEGMETAEHGVLLLRLGCQVAQGWAIARAMPPEQVAGWVADYRPDPLWRKWGGTKWDLSDFPLLVAQYDHMRWIDQIVAAVQGQPLMLSKEEVVSPLHCRFGQWYHGHGQAQYGHLSAFQALNPVHREVHQLGQDILRLCEAGQLQQAQTSLQRLLGCKHQMLQFIDQLHRQVQPSSHG